MHCTFTDDLLEMSFKYGVVLFSLSSCHEFAALKWSPASQVKKEKLLFNSVHLLLN